MFDRFTDRARKVLGLAWQESQAWSHDYIGTEHILLGLLKECSGVASDVMKSLGVEEERLRGEVRRRMKEGTTMVTMGQLPFTPRAKRTLEFALEEASNFGHNYIGTEYLLLGLLREHDGIAWLALAACGVTPDAARDAVMAILGVKGPRVSAPVEGRPWAELRAELAELRRRVEELERRVREGD